MGKTVELGGFRLDVIDTPGHSGGHVTLVERRRRWCFCGDLYAGANPKVLRADEVAWEMVRSMRTLADLAIPDLVLFTGIGRVVPDGCRVLGECAAYLRDLGSRAAELKAEGMTAAEIRDHLLGGESVFAVLTGGHYSSENLIRSLLEDGRRCLGAR